MFILKIVFEHLQKQQFVFRFNYFLYIYYSLFNNVMLLHTLRLSARAFYHRYLVITLKFYYLTCLIAGHFYPIFF